MNILLLNWRDPWHPHAGGAEIVTYEHAKRWVKLGNTVTWITGGYYEQKKKIEIINGIQFKRFGGSLSVHLIIPLYILIYGLNYDVIVDEVHGIPFFAPLFTKVPVVAFIHEVADEIWDFMYKWPISFLGKRLERWAIRFYRHCLIWTDAPSMIEELIKLGIPKTHCISIPCPIVNISKKYQKVSKENIPTFLFVSRVVRMKGVEEVIKTFSFINRELHKAQLWIVGGGTDIYINQLQLMIKEYGVSKNVKFFGRVSEIKKMELMARAHILLHASVKEGWGLVILEAASVGTPSVVYNVPGLRDVVKNKQTGVVLGNNSPLAMAEAAVRLLRDDKEYIVYQERGKKWVSSLSWKMVSKKSLNILQSALPHKNK